MTKEKWYDSWTDVDGFVCAKWKMGRWRLPLLRLRMLHKLCRVKFSKAELISLKRTWFIGDDKSVWWTAKWKV